MVTRLMKVKVKRASWGRLKNLLMALVVLVSMALPTLVGATGVTKQSAQAQLEFLVRNVAMSSCKMAQDGIETKAWDFRYNTYNCKEGGYYAYGDLASDDVSAPIDGARLKELTISAKREFLTDYWSAVQFVLKYSDQVTPEVGTTLQRILQNTEGVGTQLLVSVMKDTKPDFVKAGLIYAPFSGPVGTVLGMLCIIIMAALVLTMANDLAYISIPIYAEFLEGGEGGNGGGGKAKWVSYEAVNAKKEAEGEGGGKGAGKVATFIYFKHKTLNLIGISVCLLYLVSGQIFGAIGWLIDLFSGLTGI